MQQINTQNNKQTSSNPQFYTLKKQIIIQDSPLFKLKEYDQNRIVFTASQPKCIGIVDNQFNHIKKYYYDDQPLALDVIEIEGQKFVVVGCRYGNIYVTSFKEAEKTKMKMDIRALKAKQQWILKPQTKQQIFVNDITHLKNYPNILINCYNNGNVAIWGLLTSKRLHTFQYLHDKYTYKLRLQKENILVSCGNDCSVIRTDLDKLKPVSVFHHPLPVWCAHPINDNQIATVGIFGRVLIWDARCNRVIQACNNDSHQTSFITTKSSDDLRLIYGDTNLLVRWDRRKNKPDLISRHFMNVSSQSILFSKNNMYVCGRGKDLCLLQPAQTLDHLTELQEVSRTFVQTLSFNSQSLWKNIRNEQSSQQQQQLQQQQHLEHLQEPQQHISQQNHQNQQNQQNYQIQYIQGDNWSDDESDMIEESRSHVISRHEIKQHIKLQSILKMTPQKLLLKEKQMQWIQQDDEPENLSQRSFQKLEILQEKQQKQDKNNEINGQSESSVMEQEKNI